MAYDYADLRLVRVSLGCGGVGGGQRTVRRDLSLGYLPHDAVNLIYEVSSWAVGERESDLNALLHEILQSPLRVDGGGFERRKHGTVNL